MDNFDARCQLSLHDWLRTISHPEPTVTGKATLYARLQDLADRLIDGSLRHIVYGIAAFYITLLALAAGYNGWQAFQRIDVSPVVTSGGGTAIPPPETLGGKR